MVAPGSRHPSAFPGSGLRSQECQETGLAGVASRGQPAGLGKGLAALRSNWLPGASWWTPIPRAQWWPGSLMTTSGPWFPLTLNLADRLHCSHTPTPCPSAPPSAPTLCVPATPRTFHWALSSCPPPSAPCHPALPSSEPQEPDHSGCVGQAPLPCPLAPYWSGALGSLSGAPAGGGERGRGV